MGVSLSILLIAVGAVLAWAVDAEVSGLDVQAVGVILLVVGIGGLIVSMAFWSSWGGFGGRHRSVEQGPGGTTVREERFD